MQVLKFGGSSVGSVEAIHQMVSIVSTSLQKEKTVVVISAMSGVTDQLLLLAQSAAQGSASYTSIIDSIEKKHTEVVKALWAYIKKNKLQDPKEKRNINADANLQKVFGGKKTVSMFEMTKLVSKHLS